MIPADLTRSLLSYIPPFHHYEEQARQHKSADWTETQLVAWRWNGQREEREAERGVKEEEHISGEQMWEPEREREEQKRDRERDRQN